MACEVCSLPDDGLHFRRKTCRACSAFWRRSIVRRSVYKCKGDNNCVLSKELRKTCAACRLKKCHEIGMCESDVQWCRDRNGPLKIKRASSSTVSLPSTPQNERARTTSFTSGYSSGETSTSLCSSPTAYYFQPAMYTVGSTLAQLQSYIQDFLRLSRAVYSMIYPERNHIDTLEFYEANHSEMVNFDRALLSLVQSMLFKINPSLEQLSTEFKSRLLRSFTSLFFPLYKSYLTLLVFPQLDDTRFVCNMGQYSNCNVNFFSADQDPNKMSNDIRLKCQQTTRKIKQLGIREIEFGALCGIICANEVELIYEDNSQSDLRNRIYQELHDDILAFYPPNQVAHRFGSLICLIQDLQHVSKEIDETLTMFKIFHPCLISALFECRVKFVDLATMAVISEPNRAELVQASIVVQS
ncbi:Nuclear receptor [Aphelenchoides besseyi]|nr:Nuclear receptor [Aphelenchoides besseyi]